MPPEGYTTVTICDELATKLTRIMAENECASYAEAIEYAANTTLVQEDEITVRELIQLLADQVEELE
jgi:metal-responsive CopG/Arc/MetJ family transcriptional regulator